MVSVPPAITAAQRAAKLSAPNLSKISFSAAVAPLPETILFKGESLETILADIAKYYGASVKFNQDAAESLQLYFEWNQALPLNEVVEQLNNFEQINITLTDKALTVK